MPPPPPPSKSYLLVFDTDSEDEDDSYRIRQQRPPVVEVRPSETPISTADPSRRRPHVVEDDEDDDDDDDDPVNTSSELDDSSDSCDSSSSSSSSNRPKLPQRSTKQKKKLNKNQKKKLQRKKKKAKSSTTNKNPSVSFSTVTIKSYSRAFSAVAVPLDGGWPLGMDLKPIPSKEEDSSPTSVTLEDFETQKQQTLKERWALVVQSQNVDSKIMENMTKRPDGQALILETRQWDYLTKMKNPLFGALLEEQRQNLFLDGSPEDGSSPLPKGRARSNSVSSPSSCAAPPKRRTRASSFSNSEHFNETYNQVFVHHVRNELEQLRNSRTKSGATGCNCRKLSVYLPPKDGGGKKAQHRRLKPSKLTQELRKRGLYDASASREVLEKILHDVVEVEPCCRGEDCFCYRNGIDCQTDACSCWHDSHVHSKSGSSGKLLSVPEIKARCGNPLGMGTVDFGAIEAYRNPFLETGICQPIGFSPTK